MNPKPLKGSLEGDWALVQASGLFTVVEAENSDFQMDLRHSESMCCVSMFVLSEGHLDLDRFRFPSF